MDKLTVFNLKDVIKRLPIEDAKQCIRQVRADELAMYYDRGEGYFRRLTSEQYAELDKWYMDWLDAPTTFIIPQRPTWFK